MALTANQVAGIANATYPSGETALSARAEGQIIEVVKDLTDNATAGTVAELTAFDCDSTYYPNGVEIISASILPATAVTANNTNYATINVNVKTSAGVAVATAATGSTTVAGLGSLTALNKYALTLTAANAFCAAGNQITVAKAVAASGVAISTAGCNPMVVRILLKAK